jgi:N-acetylmuramoyl-L-alanine amidase
VVKWVLFLILILLSTRCTTVINVPLYEYPTDWKDELVRSKTINDYSNYLSGKKIFLDPGHGGEDRKNTSRSGNVVEADVNLNVALYLKYYLQKAGAEVFLSRAIDETVPLKLRSELANASMSDLFISIHHNAPSKIEDDYTNYTSTYYHARETDYEYEPCERDVARYIQRDLSYVMRNSGGLGSFDGTYSDYNIYPGEGFSVLRNTNIPAVLVECSFHTSRWEELRLNNITFNQIQAWGIFRGIAKYFRAGLPSIQFIPDSTKFDADTYQLTFSLADSSGINPKSISVYVNRQEVKFDFDGMTGFLKIAIGNISEAENIIRIICANKNGNHSLPFHKKIKMDDQQNIVLEKIN